MSPILDLVILFEFEASVRLAFANPGFKDQKTLGGSKDVVLCDVYHAVQHSLLCNSLLRPRFPGVEKLTTYAAQNRAYARRRQKLRGVNTRE